MGGGQSPSGKAQFHGEGVRTYLRGERPLWEGLYPIILEVGGWEEVSPSSWRTFKLFPPPPVWQVSIACFAMTSYLGAL